IVDFFVRECAGVVRHRRGELAPYAVLYLSHAVSLNPPSAEQSPSAINAHAIRSRDEGAVLGVLPHASTRAQHKLADVVLEAHEHAPVSRREHRWDLLGNALTSGQVDSGNEQASPPSLTPTSWSASRRRSLAHHRLQRPPGADGRPALVSGPARALRAGAAWQPDRLQASRPRPASPTKRPPSSSHRR